MECLLGTFSYVVIYITSLDCHTTQGIKAGLGVCLQVPAENLQLWFNDLLLATR